MDELAAYLTSGPKHSNLSAESLELMGKQAANMFLDEGISLNDGIAKLAGSHHDISHEQVKRIAEFANTAVYLARHDQSKTAGADHSYPQYALADAGRIIQDLSDGARPTVITRTDIDYNHQATKPKIASADTEAALLNMFKTSSSEMSFSKDTAIQEILTAKDTLQGLKDNLSSLYDQNEALFKEATAEFYDLTKRHILEGGELSDVMQAASASGAGSIKGLFPTIVETLIKEKVASPQILKTSTQEFFKAASREVDPKHPLVQSYAAMALAGTELQKLSSALRDVEAELTEVQIFIKNSFLPKSAIKGLV